MRNFFILLFSFLFFSAIAQDKFGIANSNYSSTNSIQLNPSSSVDSKTFLNLNWIGANAFVFTNQLYIPKFSVWQMRSGAVQNPKIRTLKSKNFLYSSIAVDGLAAVLSYKGIGAGTFVRARAIVDVRNIPYELGIAISENDTTYLAQHINLDLKNVKISEMSWLEYGFNFSKILQKHGTTMLAAGTNLKYLTGINIAYANLATFKSQIVDTTIDIEQYKAKVRFNSPGWDKGKGVGIDIGVTYKKTLDYVDSYYPHSQKSSCKYIDYKYKVGLSLLDVGFIRFSRNTYKANIAGSTQINQYTSDSAIYNRFNPAFIENKPFWAILPTALSAQLDWNFDHHLYVNVTAINSLTTPRMVGVQRQNLIAITPRYELKQIEVALPFTLQRYKYPQLGLAVRARNIVIGVDNVLPFVIKSNTSGLGFYFNAGFALYKNPECWTKRPKRRKNKIYSKGTNYNKEDAKKVGNVDDSKPNDSLKVEEDKTIGKEKTETVDPKKNKIDTKRRYKWIFKRKKSKEYKAS